MSNRNAVLRGQIVNLTAKFFDAADEPKDPTNLRLSIYPPGKNPEDGALPSDAWVLDATLTSGGTGPHSHPGTLITKISEGVFTYAFTVPEDCDLGAGFDRWQGTIDLQDLDGVFVFVIVGGGSVGTTQLFNNNIVFIQVLRDVKAEDGTCLSEDTTFYFTTTYEPLYSTIRRIRLDLGPFIKDIPDDTINLAIFEASLSADANQFLFSPVNPTYLQFAIREYTTCLAELILVGALLGDSATVGKMYKSLGDLSVSRGGNLEGLRDKFKDLENCVATWKPVLQNAGNVTPGASLRPDYTVKGALAEDSITVARGWEPTVRHHHHSNELPLANSNTHRTNRRLNKTGRTRTRGGRF